MFNYVNTLRSRSQGRATFKVRLGQYAPVPSAVSAGIVAPRVERQRREDGRV